MGFLHGHPSKESQIRILYHIYRASPGVIARFAHRLDEFKILVVRQARETMPGTLPLVLPSSESEDTYDLIIRVGPSLALRFVYEKTIV